MRRSDPVPDQAQAGTTRAAEDARPAVVAGGWEGRPARGVLVALALSAPVWIAIAAAVWRPA